MQTARTADTAFFHAARQQLTALLERPSDQFAAIALRAGVTFWFMVTVVGQLIFALYVLALYGGAAIHGNLKGWNRVMPHGFVAGDLSGNVVIGIHLLLAAAVMLGGALQLIAQVRVRAPMFHRWNGRVYLAGAVVASLSGIYMVWFRSTVGDLSQHIGTSVNGGLILVCAGMALRLAIARDFPAHRRWALRLFLAVSGVWFFRIGLMFWIAINGGPAGFNPRTFEGPFLSFLAFAQFLLPLVFLELYMHCRERAGVAARFAMAFTLVGLGLATGVGVAVATMGMWLPNI